MCIRDREGLNTQIYRWWGFSPVPPHFKHWFFVVLEQKLCKSNLLVCVITSSCMMLQINPYLVANGSGCYAPYYGAPAVPSPVVISSSAPALTEATPTAPPTSLAQPCPHPEVLRFTVLYAA